MMVTKTTSAAKRQGKDHHRQKISPHGLQYDDQLKRRHDREVGHDTHALGAAVPRERLVAVSGILPRVAP